MSDDLRQLETWVAPLIAKLSGEGRRSLARVIGTGLRASQQARIAAQIAPDGTPFAARKATTIRDRGGKIRKRKAAMFPKLRMARYLKVTPTAQGVTVGFTGRTANIARVHQEGLNDRPSPNAREVRYARRQLLGFSEADREMVRDALVEYLKD